MEKLGVTINLLSITKVTEVIIAKLYPILTKRLFIQ